MQGWSMRQAFGAIVDLSIASQSHHQEMPNAMICLRRSVTTTISSSVPTAAAAAQRPLSRRPVTAAPARAAVRPFAAQHLHVSTTNDEPPSASSLIACVVRGKEPQPSPEPPPSGSTRLGEPHSIDYVKHLPVALRTRNVDIIIDCVVTGAHDAAFIRSIPSGTFTKILDLVCSGCSVEEIYEALDHAWLLHMPALELRQKHLANLMHAASSMASIRRTMQLPLSLMDYNLLLKCAAHITDKQMAINIWRDMVNDGVQPNADCYSSLLQTILWDRKLPSAAEDSGWAHPLSFRVDRYWKSVRRNNRLKYAPPPGGYESQARTIIDQLITQQGSLLDEKIIVHLMTSMAREGNLESIKDILRVTWDIYVDKLMAEGHQLYPPKHYAPTSPLRPTGELLYAIAHAFGANSEISTALRLIDVISTFYDLSIPHKVWSELFTWTYVQSRERYGRFKRMHITPNQLPPDANENLWQTLVSPPYNVRPSMKMYHLSIGNLITRLRYDIVEQRINDGVRLHLEHCRASQYAERRLSWGQRDFHDGRIPDAPMFALQHKCDIAAAAVRRDRGLIMRWCKQYLEWGNSGRGVVRDMVDEHGPVLNFYGEPVKQKDFMHEHYPGWAQCDVPNFVKKYETFCPPLVKYRTHTGIVELELKPWMIDYSKLEKVSEIDKSAHRDWSAHRIKSDKRWDGRWNEGWDKGWVKVEKDHSKIEKDYSVQDYSVHDNKSDKGWDGRWDEGWNNGWDEGRVEGW